MKFEKHPPPQSYKNSELGISLRHCQRYSLTDDNNLNGNFYCTKKQAIGYFSQTQILIESKASIINFRYNIKTIPSNQIIGKLSISTLTLRRSLRAAIEIFNQNSYKW